ncbi:hypothetical protein NON20_04100 [Synechocystis sp. B12]|nr:hypothetical protein NON20_04100 [Synechocystis sp. B12]
MNNGKQQKITSDNAMTGGQPGPTRRNIKQSQAIQGENGITTTEKFIGSMANRGTAIANHDS